MGYYMTGDFYRRPFGDYYRGDPGFWSTLGGIAKGVVGAIPGVGPIASSVLGGVMGAVAKKPVMGALPVAAGAAAAASQPGLLRTAVGKTSAIIKAHPVLTAAGAAGIIGAVGGAGGSAALHALRGGGGRRHRRMRVTNPKALRRAIRRTQGFAKLAMRTIHLVHPKKRVGFGGFKKRRRKR